MTGNELFFLGMWVVIVVDQHGGQVCCVLERKQLVVIQCYAGAIQPTRATGIGTTSAVYNMFLLNVTVVGWSYVVVVTTVLAQVYGKKAVTRTRLLKGLCIDNTTYH